MFRELLLLWKKLLGEETHVKTFASEEHLWLRSTADPAACRVSAVKQPSLAGTLVPGACVRPGLVYHPFWLTNHPEMSETISVSR